MVPGGTAAPPPGVTLTQVEPPSVVRRTVPPATAQPDVQGGDAERNRSGSVRHGPGCGL